MGITTVVPLLGLSSFSFVGALNSKSFKYGIIVMDYSLSSARDSTRILVKILRAKERPKGKARL